LAQNLAALRALATDGIQKGHMKLHARRESLVNSRQALDISR
jgi:hydroxymethylglutaryl-CoA reductase